ncbi:MAG: hypothetical protein KGY67_00325 [Candidatus Thermoplasmatota archaeon]|nr:hypothetical protein [Candidatus Thermoplasmatota archaeon]
MNIEISDGDYFAEISPKKAIKNVIKKDTHLHEAKFEKGTKSFFYINVKNLAIFPSSIKKLAKIYDVFFIEDNVIHVEREIIILVNCRTWFNDKIPI